MNEINFSKTLSLDAVSRGSSEHLRTTCTQPGSTILILQRNVFAVFPPVMHQIAAGLKPTNYMTMNFSWQICMGCAGYGADRHGQKIIDSTAKTKFMSSGVPSCKQYPILLTWNPQGIYLPHCSSNPNSGLWVKAQQMEGPILQTGGPVQHFVRILPILRRYKPKKEVVDVGAYSMRSRARRSSKSP